MTSKKESPKNTALTLEVTGSDVQIMPGASFSASSPRAASAKGSKAPALETPPIGAAQGKGDGKGSDRYAKWDFPKLIMDKIELVETAYNAIDYNVKTMLGQGILYVRKQDLANGFSQAKRHFDPEIERFISRNFIQEEFLVAKAWDMNTVFNAFSQHIFNINRSKIIQLKHLEAEFSRVSRFNESKGTVDRKNLYYSAEFIRNIKDSDLDDSSKSTTFDLYNLNDFMWLQNMVAKSATNFAHHTRPRTPRSFYYAKGPFEGLYREKGWADAAGKVPEILYHMQNDQMRLKYIIYVSVEYFEEIYGQSVWMAFTAAQKKEKFEKFRDEIQAKLVGSENIYSTLTLMCKRDLAGNLKKNIIIETFDDKAKSDLWVPDSDHADQHLLRGHGVPPSQFDVSNSNIKMNTTSGSAGRQGFNQLVTLNTYLQRLLLMDLQIVADFNTANGWSNWDVMFFIDDITHTTTNNVESGIQTNDKTIQIGN